MLVRSRDRMLLLLEAGEGGADLSSPRWEAAVVLEVMGRGGRDVWARGWWVGGAGETRRGPRSSQGLRALGLADEWRRRNEWGSSASE